jgi:HK97 family phage major capsid protein
MIPSGKCLLEMRELNALADSFLRKGNRGKFDELRKRAEQVGLIGLSTDELRLKYTEALYDDTHPKGEYRSRFERYLAGHVHDQEFRDWLVGGGGDMSITYTQGAPGGFTVPFEYDDVVREGMAQPDQVLDADVTDFTMTNSARLQPEQVSGYDLSTITASLIGEAAQQNPQTIPTVVGATLADNKIFKVSFAASYEAEMDIPNFAAKIIRAASVALGRTIGQRVLSGKGGNDINGIFYQVNGGVPTQQNATPGTITLTDINTFYFALDRWYRSQPKTGWLASDGAYKKLRAAVDGQGRPLLDVQDDKEELLGKPVYVSPGLSHASIGSITDTIIFGDLSHIVIRGTRPQLQRSIELGQADITKGEALYVARMRADATLFDPTGGVTPPLVLCNIR